MSDIQKIMTGNKMEKREAPEYLCSISDLDLSELEALGNRLEDTSTYGGGLVLKLVHGVRNGQKALADPPRNCDVGTAEEWFERWKTFCMKYDEDCTGCPLNGYTHPTAYCFAKWAQMPYEAKEKGGAK